jgi:UDP-glucose 4-epimerase
MKKLLVTGGCGFIGRNLIEYLHHNYHITIVDDLSNGSPEYLKQHPEIDLVQMDFTDINKLNDKFNNHHFDSIIHLAAIASVEFCQKNQIVSNRVNQDGVIDLFGWAMDKNIKQFIFASSAAVYGDIDKVPVSETDSTKPISFYGEQKLNAETYLRKHQNQLDNVLNFRFFNIFGPFQDPHSPYSGVLSIFCHLVKTQAKPVLKIFGDGLQERDFLPVNSLVSVLEQGLQGKINSGVYNLGTGKAVKLIQIVSYLSEISGKDIQVDYHPAREGDIKKSCAEITKIKSQNIHFDPDFFSFMKEYYENFV